MRAQGEKLLVEILRNSGNKSRTKAQPAARKGETDFLYCPSAPATTRTVTIEGIRARELYSKRVEKRFIQKEGGGVFLSRTPRDATNGRNNCSKLKPHPLRVSVRRWRLLLADHFSLPHFVLRFPRCELHVVTVDVADSSSTPPSSRYFCTTGHRCW